MATQEERLETLESDFRQFKMETIKAYQDAAVDLTMIKGLAVDSIARLKNVDRQFDIVDLRLSDVRRDVEGLEGRLVSFEQHVDSRFEGVDKRFDSVDKRLEAHDKRFDGIEKRLEAHDKRFDGLEKKFDSLDNKFDQVLLMLAKLIPGPRQGT